ncbi:MAG: hypothetical protein AMXMBFR48_30220 [Ignavibacteriales bacterium]
MNKTVFFAGKQILKVRFVVSLLLLSAPVLFWAGTLVIGDPYVYNMQEQSSELHQYFWGIVFMLSAVSMAVGILIYQDCYIKKMEYNEDADSFTLYTESLIGKRQRTFTHRDIQGWREDDGYYRNIKFTINAPYITFRIKDRRLPYIIDLQGKVVEDEIYTLKN